MNVRAIIPYPASLRYSYT